MNHKHMLILVGILLASAACVMRASQDNSQKDPRLSLYTLLAGSRPTAQASTQEVAFGQPSDDTEFNKNNIVYPVYGMPHHTSQMQEYYQAQLRACGGVLDRSNVSHHDMRSLIIATAKRIQPISVIAAFAAGWIFARWKYKSVPCKKAKDKKCRSALQTDCSDDSDCYYEGIYE